MNTLILASASPRRRELLSQAGIRYEAMICDVDEGLAVAAGPPEQQAEQTALLKARNVAQKITAGLVLGADTIVVCDNEIFGKPADEKDAQNMLERLSGREHRVITGMALVDAFDGKTAIGHEVTFVKFSELRPGDIHRYIKTGEPFDKAGAYAIQGKGGLFVEALQGCYSNVVGLPLNRFARMLQEFKLTVWDIMV